jgi:uncharacterized protein YgiB involved in biofilm formation
MSGRMPPYDPTQDVMRRRQAAVASAAALAALLLAACSDAKSVAFYKEHQAERAKTVGDCLAMGSDSQNCLNARQADFEAQGIPAKDGKALQP